MKYSYQLQKEDFLEYQLYSITQTATYRTKLKRNRYMIPVVYFGLGLYEGFLKTKWLLAALFIAMGVTWIIAYPYYINWLYKRHFKRNLITNYGTRIGKIITIDLEESFISVQEGDQESRIEFRDVEELVALPNHFLIMMSGNHSLVIPKNDIQDKRVFKDYFSKQNITYIDEQSWSWK